MTDQQATRTDGKVSASTLDDEFLTLADLTKEFGSLAAVDSVSLSVPEGELHSIIGPNGAGKTTLFSLIAGSLSPTSGEIRYRGQNITDRDEYQRAQRGISRVFQIAQLFPNLTVRENIRLGLQARDQSMNPFVTVGDGTDEAIERMLDRLNLPPEITAENLAHGDKKKLEMGISITSDPDLLLLDEPTSGVSAGESEDIIDLIDELRDDFTILLIEHDVDMVLKLSDRITVLHQGRVISQGDAETIMADEEVQRAYLGGYKND
ncbi:ABC transporter ATP-binding protein [Haloplanus rallus]|jgi:branched-chain amino acid transport system ATP-binding protein|uniref:ABC transporter ATP-binding protein n=1 Tax=Haloplanus rallus TaxID=1816183 RepID=A0A6B9F2I3_9EURY|nr:ABC transporter ATP-binding protein [Haloplanus rallus]QGX94555.1 ABC transporter ATP-binding protein [Haloplanus rallus]